MAALFAICSHLERIFPEPSPLLLRILNESRKHPEPSGLFPRTLDVP